MDTTGQTPVLQNIAVSSASEQKRKRVRKSKQIAEKVDQQGEVEQQGDAQGDGDVQNDVEAQQSKTCEICCYNYTDRLRPRVTCNNCQKDMCKKCAINYILSSQSDAHCMYCKAFWSFEFIDSISHRFLMNEFRRHREDILFDREKSKIPETQALYETVQQRKSIIIADTHLMRKERQKLRHEWERAEAEYQDRIGNLILMIRELEASQSSLNRILSGEVDTIADSENIKAEIVKKAQAFIYQCGNQNCKGMLNGSFDCPLCKSKSCPQCLCTITNTGTMAGNENAGGAVEPSHTCNPDDVETVKMLRENSKSCPGCSILIYKIDGCDQMWCTSCHTPFSWTTGERIVSGQIHNPHFYRWKQENGGLDAGAVDINGRAIGITPIESIERAVMRITKNPLQNWINGFHREIVEIADIELNMFNALRREYADPIRSMRLAYMQGRVSGPEFKVYLYKHEKGEMQKLEMRQVYELYVEQANSIFRKIVEAKKIDTLRDLQAQLFTTIEYVFDNLKKINARFGSARKPHYASSYQSYFEHTDALTYINPNPQPHPVPQSVRYHE